MSDRLDETPRVVIDVVADHSSEGRCDTGFLRMRRLSLKNRYADGDTSAAYRYDLVERDALDAVAIVLWASGPRIVLRSAIRPPLAFRQSYALPIPESDANAVQWEVPAGLVERDEHGLSGLKSCAAREAMEEVGCTIAPSAFELLGPAAFLSPGVMAEKIHFLCAQIDPDDRRVPTEDGSPVEERAEVRFVALDAALSACREGRIADLKTEIAIRRLLEAGVGT